MNMRRQPRQYIIDRLFDRTQLNHPILPCIPWFGVGPSLPGLCCNEQPLKITLTCRSCRRLRSFDLVFNNQHQKIAACGSSYRETTGTKKPLESGFFAKEAAGYRPDISLMAPFNSSSEQSAQVPFGGIELIPVMALARMPSRPPW
ncbi:hypothetical protein D3C71_1147350 [compost metagenome]